MTPKSLPSSRRAPRKRKDASELNPTSYVLWLLGRRDYSEKELRDKMRLRGFEPEAIDKGIEYAKESGYQSDARYASQKAAALGRRLGNGRISRELKDKGIEPAAISEELATLEPELDRAVGLLGKYEGQPMTPELRGKVTRFLAYRGFGFDVIKKAIRQLGARDD